MNRLAETIDYVGSIDRMRAVVRLLHSGAPENLIIAIVNQAFDAYLLEIKTLIKQQRNNSSLGTEALPISLDEKSDCIVPCRGRAMIPNSEATARETLESYINLRLFKPVQARELLSEDCSSSIDQLVTITSEQVSELYIHSLPTKTGVEERSEKEERSKKLEKERFIVEGRVKVETRVFSTREIVTLERDAEGWRVRNIQLSQPNTIPLSSEERLLYWVFKTSELYEKNQEDPLALPLNSPWDSRLQKQKKYQPTADDLLIRWVKALLFISMGRRSHFAAVALGTILRRHKQKDVLRLGDGRRLGVLTEDILWDPNNGPTVAGTIIAHRKHGLYQRFRNHNEIFDDPLGQMIADHRKQGKTLPFWWTDLNSEQLLKTRDCTPDEEKLIDHFLRRVALPIPDAPSASVACLQEYFRSGMLDPGIEAERIRHCLLTGGNDIGICRLIDKFNRKTRTEHRIDPRQGTLRIPVFQVTSGGPNPSHGSGSKQNESNGPGSKKMKDRAAQDASTSSEIHSTVVEQQPKRRKDFHARSPLWIEVEGEKVGTLTQSCSLSVPSDAHSFEVWGEDEQGALLLAVFPLELLEDELTHPFIVIIEGGKEISISLKEVAETETRLSLEYKDPFPGRGLQPAASVTQDTQIGAQETIVTPNKQSPLTLPSFPIKEVSAWLKSLIAPPRMYGVIAIALVFVVIGVTLEVHRRNQLSFETTESAPAKVSRNPQLVIIFRKDISLDTLQEVLKPFKGNTTSGPTSPSGKKRYFVVEVQKPLQSRQELDHIVEELMKDERIEFVAIREE